jgi:hypothetical protein
MAYRPYWASAAKQWTLEANNMMYGKKAYVQVGSPKE